LGDFFKVHTLGFFAVTSSFIDYLKFTNVDLNDYSYYLGNPDGERTVLK
jgi:hypothetical protein